MVNQFYKAEILTEYVIRGNTAILKCSIPSFVADFVHVEAWIDDSGNILKVSNEYGNFSSTHDNNLCSFSAVVSQFYVTEAENEYVIRGNAAIMKCKIPSFVADFVQIDSWVADDGKVLKYGDGNSGTCISVICFNCLFLHSSRIYTFHLTPSRMFQRINKDIK